MQCKCGANMVQIDAVPLHKHFPFDYIMIWACQPTGCGRLLLQGAEAAGTWYTPEENEGGRDMRRLEHG